MHPLVNLVHIPMLITEVNQVHVMIVLVVNIQAQKLSIMYHLCLVVIHLACFLNPINGVVTLRKKMNRLCVINQYSNKTGVGYAINHCSLHSYPTKKKETERKLFSGYKYGNNKLDNCTYSTQYANFLS